MAVTAPTLIATVQSANYTAKTTPRETAELTVAKGDVLIACAQSANAEGTQTMSIEGGGLTWTKQKEFTTTSNTPTWVWTATATEAKSFKVKCSYGSVNDDWGVSCQQWRGSSGIGAVAGINNKTGAPELSITTGSEHSAIAMFSADWEAKTGTATYRTGAGTFTQSIHVEVSGQYTVYVGEYKEAGAAGAYTVGMTAPTGQKYTIVGVEVKGEAEEEGKTWESKASLTGSGSLSAKGVRGRQGVASVAGTSSLSAVGSSGTPPKITAESAGSLTETGATLKVTYPATPTTAWFEYGTTEAYGTKVEGSKSKEALFATKAITGLNPGTTYHYRAVLVNEWGETLGTDQTFKTTGTGPVTSEGKASVSGASAVSGKGVRTARASAAVSGTSSVAPKGSNSGKPEITGYSVSEITETSANVHVTFNAAHPPTAIYIRYGETTSYGHLKEAFIESGSGHVTLESLTAGTVWHWKPELENGVGTTEGVDQTFTTIALQPGNAHIFGSSAIVPKGLVTHRASANVTGTSILAPKGAKETPSVTWTGKASIPSGASVIARGVNPQEGAAGRETRKPPLDLDVEVETTHGTFRLASDDKHAKNRPTGITFTTERTNGFGTASFTLSRDIFRDYPDINLLDTLRFVSKDGEIAYEGRLHSNPRSNSPSSQLSVALVGWMTYLKSRKISPLIIDRRLGGWTEPTVQRKADITPLGYRYEGAVSTAAHGTAAGLGGAVLLSFSTFDATYTEIGEAWMYAGGEDIGSLRFDFARLEGSAPGNVEWHGIAFLCADDRASSFDQSTQYHIENFNNGFVNATVEGRKYGMFSFTYTVAATAGTFGNTLAHVNPRIVGTHGIGGVGEWPNEGFQISDIIRYIIQTYYPKINTAGIQTNSFPVQQATWHDNPNYGYEIIQELNNLTLWETNVWEGREFCFEAADLTKNDWCIRTDEPGVTVSFQGDSIENFANGVTVSYEDVAGIRHTLTPDSHPELLDQSLNNPATEHGENLWIDAEVSWPTGEAEALQFGRAYLAEYNRPKRPGQFTVAGGYIKDSAGHWHQGWKVRCSESIGVMDDLFEAQPRLITATSWDAESETLTITVDAPPQTIEALIARNSIERTARNM